MDAHSSLPSASSQRSAHALQEALEEEAAEEAAAEQATAEDEAAPTAALKPGLGGTLQRGLYWVGSLLKRKPGGLGFWDLRHNVDI